MATYVFTNASNVTQSFTTIDDSISLQGVGTTDNFALLSGDDSLSVSSGGIYSNLTVSGGLGNDAIRL